jgi:hypothetical protein
MGRGYDAPFPHRFSGRRAPALQQLSPLAHGMSLAADAFRAPRAERCIN